MEKMSNVTALVSWGLSQNIEVKEMCFMVFSFFYMVILLGNLLIILMACVGNLLLLLPIPPSITVFSNESTLYMRWPKYWSFSFSISPSKEHSGLISFRMDCLALLAVQETLKSLLQHHSSKHQFFGTQLSSQSNSHIHT